jgi:hypothetical protein
VKNGTVQVRQGDVLLTRVARIPAGAKEKVRDNGRIVLAYGEATGHCHTIEDSLAAPRAALVEVDELTFLRVDEVSRVVHEEHDPITLEPGNYRITRQREYTPEAIVNVSD